MGVRSLLWGAAAVLIATGCSSTSINESSNGGSGGAAGDPSGGSAGSATGGASGGSGGTAGGGAAGSGAGGSGAGGAGGSAGSSNVATLDQVRAMPEGAVDVVVTDLYVTYLRPKGYTVQQQRQGPGLYVFTGMNPIPVAVGNRIDLHIGKLSTFNNVFEADDTTVLANDAGSYDVVTNLAQTLTTGGGIPPSQDLESELVAVNGGMVGANTGSEWTISYGGVSTKLFVVEDPGLCNGATFDLVALASDWASGPQLNSDHAADFSNLDTTACTN